MKKMILWVGFISFLTIFSCKDMTEKRQETSLEKKLERKYEKAQDYTYTNWVLKSSDSVRKVFKEKFTSAELTTIVALNRVDRSEEHTSELQSRENLVCRLLLEKKKN